MGGAVQAAARCGAASARVGLPREPPATCASLAKDFPAPADYPSAFDHQGLSRGYLTEALPSYSIRNFGRVSVAVP
jgi:hypothetical protein